MARKHNGTKNKHRSGPSSVPARRARRIKSLQKFLKAYGAGAEGKAHREAFAKRVGTTLPYLVHLAWGFRQASTDLAIKIERASHGLVPLEDMRDDIDWGYLATRKPKVTTTYDRPTGA